MNVPKDELVLAELIAAASAHGLVGCRGWRFMSADRYLHVPPDVTSLTEPPVGATACCAQGARMLLNLPDFCLPWQGNDASEHDIMAFSSIPEWISGWNIAAAFNQAMDPNA